MKIFDQMTFKIQKQNIHEKWHNKIMADLIRIPFVHELNPFLLHY